MELKLEEAAYFDFVTHHPTTGAATDADSTPTAEVFEDATDTTVVALTVTKRTSKTGNYRVPVTAAAADGFEVGKTYNVVASATVNSIAAKGVIGRFKVRTRGKDDLAYPATSGRSLAVDASGQVTVGAMATDTLTASALASSAVTEIQAGLSTLDAAGVRTAVGLASANLDTQIAAVQADTDNIQTRLPAALVSGRIDASVGAMASDTLTSTALAASAVTEIQSGLSTLDAAGVRTAVGLASANLDTQLAAIAGYIDTEVTALSTNVSTVLTRLGVPASDVATIIAAIKAKTDNLTFTSGTFVDANIQAVNDVTLQGTGVETSDEWRPA